MKTETLEAIGAAGNKATILGGSVAVAGKLSVWRKRLDYDSPHRFGPNGLAALLPRLFC